MKNKRQLLGKAGEDFAVRFLEEAGLKVIVRNYRCPKGEMDLIARDGEALVFVEVRTRKSSLRGWGEESITWQKAKRLQSTASYYLLQQGYNYWPAIRFDVLALRWKAESPVALWIKAAL